MQMEKNYEKSLSNRNTSNVARSLTRDLYMVEDGFKKRSHDSNSGRGVDLSRLFACDSEMAGLGYVNSQDPGESSQADALDFVDKFLKLNVLESDQEDTLKNAVDGIVSSFAIAKGPRSLAQQANHRSTLAGASVFDWNETHEDESGGEFFMRNKELFGTNYWVKKCCNKSPMSRLDESRLSRSCEKAIKEKENPELHDNLMSIVHSDSKLTKRRNIRQLKMNKNKKVDNDRGHQVGINSCCRDALEVIPYAGSTEVGKDTQMAAEGMEALSSRSPLQVNGGTLAVKNDCSVASRTRSRYAVVEVNVGIEPKGRQRRLNKNNICSENERELSEKASLEASGKNISEDGMKITGSLLVKGRTLLGKIGSSTEPTLKAIQVVNVKELSNDGHGSGDSTGRRGLDKVQDGRDKRRCIDRSDVDFETSDAREDVLNVTCMTASINNDGSRGREDFQHSSRQVNGKRRKPTQLVGSSEHGVMQSIARRTRSRCSARCVEVPKEDETKHMIDMLSLENLWHLSPKRHKACSTKEAVMNAAWEESPGKMRKSSSSTNFTPDKLNTPRIAVSPACEGDENLKSSCKKNQSLKKEVRRLYCNERKCSTYKFLRQRRKETTIRIFFCKYLDEDISRSQKKILSLLGVLEASSMSNATHFVADMFVRTNNMLEAIASGKPVVTHLWLECCGQVGCLIDEKNYILRDVKKERELGFNMPISLACASRRPLLEDRRVLITPNVRPGKTIISSLVKIVGGQAMMRLCRTMSDIGRLSDGLLVLSCEEDFEDCVSLLEKGIAIYDSELLLSGIITQKLEYERYRIFVDYVKKTRSTIWVKDGFQYRSVRK